MAILDQYLEYRSALNIWKTVPPILLVLGTLGNVLTIIVLMRGRSRSSSTGMYLIALALSDLLVLWAGLLRQWIIHMFDMDVRHLSATGCKINIFLVYFGTQCSSWLLVALTSERFIGVWLPHKLKQGCTSRSACAIISLIVACIMLLNVHWLFGMGDQTIVNNNVTYELKCNPMYDNYEEFLALIWPWIDLCIFCLVPFTLLFTGNISIITRVLIIKHKTRTRVAPPSRSTGAKHADKTSQMAAMLLTLNAVFCVCVTPISIYLIGEPHWLKTIETHHEEAVLTLWWAIVNSFMYLNNTLNFVLYFLSGSRFRREVKALFCGGQALSLFVGATLTRAAPLSTAMRSINTANTENTNCIPSSTISVLHSPSPNPQQVGSNT